MREQTEQTTQVEWSQIGSDCASFNFRKASRAVTQLYDEALAPSGIRVTQFSILSIIRNRRSMTISELADVLVMDRTTLTRNLRLLEKQGFIATRVGEDRRQRMVSLTTHGRDVLAEAAPLWRQAQASFIDRLGHEEWRRLRKQLSSAVEVARRS